MTIPAKEPRGYGFAIGLLTGRDLIVVDTRTDRIVSVIQDIRP